MMPAALSPKAAKRLERLLKSIDRVLDQMSHADLRALVEEWNGPPNIRQNLIDFADWQQRKLAFVDAAKEAAS